MFEARRLLLAFVVAIGALGIPGASPVHAQTPDAGWAVAPAGPDGRRSRTSFAYNVKPGQVLRDKVAISNLSDKPLHVDLYSRDAFNTSEDGAFALQAFEESAEDAGAWITFGVSDYVVPPGKRADIPFELSVPADATPGDHTAGIIAANREVIASEDTGATAVDVRQRIAARVYLRVDGDLVPELQISELSIDASTPFLPFQGRSTITYEVRNVGNVRLVASADLKVTGMFGRTVHRFAPEDLPDLLPGGSVRITRTFNGVPPAERLHASLELTSIDQSTSTSASAATFG